MWNQIQETKVIESGRMKASHNKLRKDQEMTEDMELDMIDMLSSLRVIAD